MDNCRPNILFVLSDDHAAPAISCYGSQINKTPNIDRIGNEGMRFNNFFCTNSICTPARASVLTGKYGHKTGVKTLGDTIDQSKHRTFAQILHQADYQTAIVGKWHLGQGDVSQPWGFDYWSILKGQGRHSDPEMNVMGETQEFTGYTADVITDLSLDWLNRRSADRPFLLMCTYKATHDPFVPNPKHLDLYRDQQIPEPENFEDDYENRAKAAEMSTQRVSVMHRKNHLPEFPPDGLSPSETKRWNYQCYMKNYLRCATSIDENVGRLLDCLDNNDLSQNTMVIYTADHGFFLGNHGWYDKRFMYEESLRVPCLIRYPNGVKPETSDLIGLNIDYAPTLLDYANVPIPSDMQGHSLRNILSGTRPTNWRTSMYYRYWMHLAHFNVPAHYGIRTDRYKLIHYYGESDGATGAIDRATPPEWELFDLDKDPTEMENVYHNSEYAGIIPELKAELKKLQTELY